MLNYIKICSLNFINLLHEVQQEICDKLGRLDNRTSWFIECPCITFYIPDFPHKGRKSPFKFKNKTKQYYYALEIFTLL